MNFNWLQRKQPPCSTDTTMPITHPQITPGHTYKYNKLSELQVRHHCPFFSTYCFTMQTVVTNTHFSVTFTHKLLVCFFFVILDSCVFLVIFHCTYTYNNCASLSNCCNILCIFQNSTCGNSAWYIWAILHVELWVCVCVCMNCALPGHTTYTVCMVYGLRQHFTVLSAHFPCLLLKGNSFVPLFRLYFWIAAKFISQLQKQIFTYTNVTQSFVPKTVFNNQFVRAFRIWWKEKT